MRRIGVNIWWLRGATLRRRLLCLRRLGCCHSRGCHCNLVCGSARISQFQKKKKEEKEACFCNRKARVSEKRLQRSRNPKFVEENFFFRQEATDYFFVEEPRENGKPTWHDIV